MSGFAGTGLTIGSVTLAGFEIPDHINWGGEQAVKEFTYPGGVKQFQALGPTRGPITWRGQMITPDATDRARQLEQIMAAGSLVSLSWGDLNFTVIVTKFEADYHHQWQGDYSITVLVQSDFQAMPAADNPQTLAANDLGSAGGLLSQVTGGISAVAGQVQAVVSQVQGAVNSVLLPAEAALGAIQGAAASIGLVTQGIAVPGALFATQGAIQGALNSIGTAAAASGTILANIAAVPNTIAQISAAAAQTAGCVAAWGYTARAVSNWTQVAGISTPNGATPQAPNLTGFVGA